MAPTGVETICWADWDGPGLQQVLLARSAGGLRFEGMAIASPPDGPSAHFEIEADADWIVRRVAVRRLGTAGEILLEHDGRGRWTRDGRHEPALDGAMEPDISVTPLTNSFPVRRLGLAAGQGADIVTAYVDLGTMRVFADPQRYTCLVPGRRYRYDSLDSDFSAEIEFAGDGLVETYRGLFRRLRARLP